MLGSLTAPRTGVTAASRSGPRRSPPSPPGSCFPTRLTGDADHPEDPYPQGRKMDNRNGLRGGRPRLRTSPTPTTRGLATRTLGHRKPPQLGTRRHLGRRPEPDPHTPPARK